MNSEICTSYVPEDGDRNHSLLIGLLSPLSLEPKPLFASSKLTCERRRGRSAPLLLPRAESRCSRASNSSAARLVEEERRVKLAAKAFCRSSTKRALGRTCLGINIFRRHFSRATFEPT